MSYQEDLIMSIYDRGEPGLAMSNRGDMAKEWYEGWKKQNGLPADSNALPPVEATPPWARPYLFPRAEATPNEGMMIAGVPNFPGGGYSSTSGAFVDLSGEAYFLMDGELIPQGGYDPAKHGDLIPHGGPDVPQAKNNQDMMIANFLTGKTGEGKTLTDEAYDAGYQTIMDTTEEGSGMQQERLKILNHQYFDQI